MTRRSTSPNIWLLIVLLAAAFVIIAALVFGPDALPGTS